jgi:hypothetical protein
MTDSAAVVSGELATEQSLSGVLDAFTDMVLRPCKEPDHRVPLAIDQSAKNVAEAMTAIAARRMAPPFVIASRRGEFYAAGVAAAALFGVADSRRMIRP